MKTIIRYFSFVMGLMLTLPSFAKKISIMLDWYVNPDHAAIIVAQQKRLFFEKKITWRLKLSNLLILHYRRN